MMGGNLKIALDVMGSDIGVAEIVAGAAMITVEPNSTIEVTLVGDAVQIDHSLRTLKYDPSKISIVDAQFFITQDDSPKKILHQENKASVVVASELVQKNLVDGMVSAGNTGAVILSAAKHFKRLSGVRRTALAAVYPTELPHGPKGDPFALMLDVGATLHVDAYDLAVFAVMGSAYAKVISGNPSPKVALLSNGTEPSKGAPEVVAAHQLIVDLSCVNFIGNVEGLDIPKGTADVIVCEGFLGNVALKMLEGVSEVASALAKDAYARKFLWRLGLTILSKELHQLRSMMDWKQYGGAPILGFDQVVIKAHGRSNARAIRNAIKVAAKAVKGELISSIKQGVDSLQEDQIASSNSIS
jgi:phosphate acyltransferase